MNEGRGAKHTGLNEPCLPRPSCAGSFNKAVPISTRDFATLPSEITFTSPEALISPLVDVVEKASHIPGCSMRRFNTWCIGVEVKVKYRPKGSRHSKKLTIRSDKRRHPEVSLRFEASGSEEDRKGSATKKAKTEGKKRGQNRDLELSFRQRQSEGMDALGCSAH